MNKRILKAAIGASHAASLVLNNGRARTEIVRHSWNPCVKAQYTLQGDVPLQFKNAARLPMTADKAHALALRCLAAYNRD